jgi:hypothetical protein
LKTPASGEELCIPSLTELWMIARLATSIYNALEDTPTLSSDILLSRNFAPDLVGATALWAINHLASVLGQIVLQRIIWSRHLIPVIHMVEIARPARLPYKS